MGYYKHVYGHKTHKILNSVTLLTKGNMCQLLTLYIPAQINSILIEPENLSSVIFVLQFQKVLMSQLTFEFLI